MSAARAAPRRARASDQTHSAHACALASPSLLLSQAHVADRLVGAIICKEETEKARVRGYIAMLVVEPAFRKLGIGLRLAELAISRMRETCDEVRVSPARGTPHARAVSARPSPSAPLPTRARSLLQIVLETEVSNSGALRLYEGLGFLRDRRLPKYYLNGSDAFRLKCWVR